MPDLFFQQGSFGGTTAAVFKGAELRRRDLGELFALVVFLAEEYLTFKRGARTLTKKWRARALFSKPDAGGATKDANEVKAVRFLRIASSLPLDLQMILCNTVFGSAEQFILCRDSEPGFKRVAKKVLLAEGIKS